MIEKDEVLLSISYVDCEYVWSEPNGKSNLALGDKYLSKYNSNSAYSTVYGPQNDQESKSAAAMLAERDQ